MSGKDDGYTVEVTRASKEKVLHMSDKVFVMKHII